MKLIDCFPDGGEQRLVRGDAVRGRYRDGFTRPKAFVPGKPECVRLRTTDIAHTFRAGHRIMVQVQSSWFPLMERNPQQFMDLLELYGIGFRALPGDAFPPARPRFVRYRP